MPSFRALPPHGRPGEPDTQHAPVPVSEAMVDCAVYLDGRRLPGPRTHRAAVQKLRELREDGRTAFAWIGLHEPDEQQMQTVAADFGLHALAVEDAVHAHQRPKLELYDNTLFLVLKTVNYVPHESIENAREIVETGEIMVFVGHDFVVTVRHGEHSGLAAVRRQLEDEQNQLRLGPFAVMHAIADHVVDRYLAVTALVEGDIDDMEEDIFSAGGRTDVTAIYMLKHEVLELRRAVAPLTDALTKLQNDYRDLLSKEVLRYMRDVLDHQIQAAERIAGYDDLLTSLVQAALAKVGMQQNTDMRKISAWVAIAAVPTMVAGIYGMNFEYMPELDWPWSYPAVLCTVVLVCVLIYARFRRNDWL